MPTRSSRAGDWPQTGLWCRACGGPSDSEVGAGERLASEHAGAAIGAALATFDEIGYLTFAGTVEADRRRGAQSALIARRVEDAKSAGCAQVVSQTLTMLEDSFANLERCGFREIYEQEVYALSLE